MMNNHFNGRFEERPDIPTPSDEVIEQEKLENIENSSINRRDVLDRMNALFEREIIQLEILNVSFEMPSEEEILKGTSESNGSFEVNGVKDNIGDNVEDNNKPYSELTDEEKLKIKEETGWSDEIIDHIKNMDQYEIYKNADLHEEEINGRKCLVKNIDMDYVDPKTGMTNRERLSHKPHPLSPIDSKTGEKIELHHMGQDFDGPFAELCENSEHGDGNHSVLHDVNSESWRRDPEKKHEYQEQKDAHWNSRMTEG